MRVRNLGVYAIFSLALAVFGAGCGPYHRHGVGVEVDIHAKEHRDHHDNDHHDDDHHDRDDHHDDDRH